MAIMTSKKKSGPLEAVAVDVAFDDGDIDIDVNFTSAHGQRLTAPLPARDARRGAAPKAPAGV